MSSMRIHLLPEAFYLLVIHDIVLPSYHPPHSLVTLEVLTLTFQEYTLQFFFYLLLKSLHVLYSHVCR